MRSLHGSNASLSIVQAQHLLHFDLNNGTQPNTSPVRQDQMAQATDIRVASQSALVARFYDMMDTVRQQRARRKVFNATFRELQALSNRELADLGLGRSEIRRVALQAAYDI
jgi:uncharacterized protein YjiS (DUF1127 family)